jgi:hypothetical protein
MVMGVVVTQDGVGGVGQGGITVVQFGVVVIWAGTGVSA